MTHADINDLETRDYIFKIGDRGKGIQARYDKNTDALIFPRIAFDYVVKMLNDELYDRERHIEQVRDEITELDMLYSTKTKILEIIDKYTDGVEP